jgi:hypothetical protein
LKDVKSSINKQSIKNLAQNAKVAWQAGHFQPVRELPAALLRGGRFAVFRKSKAIEFPTFFQKSF